MKSTSLVCLTAAIALAAHPSSAATRTWNKASGGTYEWNADNFGGTLPTADDDANFGGLSPNTYRPTGDQTITGNGQAKTLDFYNNAYSTSRTFTGDITASNIVLRVGTVNIEGTLNLTGTDQTYSLVGAAVFDSAHQGGTLNIQNGGTLRADGVHGICVGRRVSTTDNSNASGRIVLEKGGRLVLNPSGTTASMAGLQLGRLDGKRTGTYSASYVQKGGEAVLGRIMTGFEKNTFPGIAVLGGSLDLPYINNDTRFRIAHYGYGSFQLLGGEVNCETNYLATLSTAQDCFATRAFAFEVGRSIANGLKGAYFYANGGVFKTGNDFAISGATGSDTGACAPLHATIDGNALVDARTMRIGANQGGGAAILNLNGGELRSDFIFANEGRNGASVVNADGGRICFKKGTALQQQFLFIDAVNIYEGGLEIEVARESGVSIGNAGTNVVLRTPTGYGVDIARIENINSSLTPPWIEISGGSGSNATAVAFVDYDTDVMTNAAMVCRGEGYAADDRPVATVIRPYGTTTITDRIELSVSENKPGALVKTGGYNLNLFAQPEFAGTYEVRQGYMIQTTTAGVAAPKVKAVVAGGGSGNSIATFQAGSGNSSAVEDNWNPINPAATLTLGTAHGAGRLSVPGAAAGQTKPFEQTFASLTVNGTGNSVIWAGGNDHDVGAKVTFGMIDCAEGSGLTIPRWDSKFKVYVDTSKTPVGTRFKNIKFDGAGPEVFAEVAEDGQLVKAKQGMMIIVK